MYLHSLSIKRPYTTCRTVLLQLDYKPQQMEEISLESDEDIKELLDDIKEWKKLHSE